MPCARNLAASSRCRLMFHSTQPRIGWVALSHASTTSSRVEVGLMPCCFMWSATFVSWLAINGSVLSLSVALPEIDTIPANDASVSEDEQIVLQSVTASAEEAVFKARFHF